MAIHYLVRLVDSLQFLANETLKKRKVSPSLVERQNYKTQVVHRSAELLQSDSFFLASHVTQDLLVIDLRKTFFSFLDGGLREKSIENASLLN